MKRKILAFVMAVTLSLSAVEVIPQLNDTIVAEAATVGCKAADISNRLGIHKYFERCQSIKGKMENSK